ncbi:MAG: response regulator [Candidatus Pacebacteria bacterium]|nr:response regulator [Candidatus Paceibacterota bacterium]
MEETKQKRSVLIVDDEESLTNVLARKFTDEGIIAYTAYDGKQGLELALEKHPDVILLDIMMPEMDGFDVMKALQQDPWGKDVPVILLTNSSSLDTVAKAVTSGMSEFLVKTEMKLDQVVDHVKRRFE